MPVTSDDAVAHPGAPADVVTGRRDHSLHGSPRPYTRCAPRAGARAYSARARGPAAVLTCDGVRPVDDDAKMPRLSARADCYTVAGDARRGDGDARARDRRPATGTARLRARHLPRCWTGDYSKCLRPATIFAQNFSFPVAPRLAGLPQGKSSITFGHRPRRAMPPSPQSAEPLLTSFLMLDCRCFDDVALIII